jgi:hypothetical protein
MSFFFFKTTIYHYPVNRIVPILANCIALLLLLLLINIKMQSAKVQYPIDPALSFACTCELKLLTYTVTVLQPKPRSSSSQLLLVALFCRILRLAVSSGPSAYMRPAEGRGRAGSGSAICELTCFQCTCCTEQHKPPNAPHTNGGILKLMLTVR